MGSDVNSDTTIDPGSLLRDLALDPRNSVVVSACAGSGKTWLLVSRIIRALLAGAEPSEILAVTFTRKAAQEMQARLNEWLELLALGEEIQVREFLRERGLVEASLEAALPQARGLFEKCLNSHPGITISTFHTWFLQLLQRAPLKSGLAGELSLISETSSLIEEAWQRLAQELSHAPDSPLAQNFQDLLRDYGLHNTRKALQHFINKRGEWWSYTRDDNDPAAAALTRLQQTIQLALDEPVLEKLFTHASLLEDLQNFADLLEKNQTATDLNHADLIRAGFSAAGLAQRFQHLCGAFFTQAGSRLARKENAARAKRLGARDADYLNLHATLCERLEAARDALIEQNALRFNRAVFICGSALLQHFQQLKTERGVVDFSDVEYGAERLIGDSEHAAYMQYKLDARYRHILLDEFQDTNPLQWQMLQHWFDAAMAAERTPKIFLVGDPKQSIYRFRGADARIFDLAQAYLGRHFQARQLSLDRSRRSAQAVLDGVNQVFDKEALPHFQPHHAVHANLPGGIWVQALPAPLPTVNASETMRNPLEQPLAEVEEAAQRGEASQIATQLKSMVGIWKIRAQGRVRRLDYGDVLLLTQARTHLSVYETALSEAGIPFMTARQGGLLDSLEARDLTALLEFLILPAADLQLAHVLRTPIFDITDATLLALSRTGQASWWQSLAWLAQQQNDPPVVRAFGLLSQWRAQLDQLPVHDLLDRIFHEGEVLARYAALTPLAMRAAVQANLSRFLEMALSLDSGRYPSLPKFVDELKRLRQLRDEEAPDLPITQDAGRAVRILTVHGAKGLEAPIVWLFDTNRVLPARDDYQALIDWPPGAPVPRHFSMLSTRKALGQARADLLVAQNEWVAREEMNLLYVAMTRAQQYLIVSGAAAAEAKGGSWYARIAAVCPPVQTFAPAPDFEPAHATLPELESPTQATIKKPLPTVSDAIHLGAPLPLGQRQSSAIDSAAAQYGVHLHRFLERMAPPAIAPSVSQLQNELSLSAEICADLWHTAQSILQAPLLRRFFDPAQYTRACNELPFMTAAGELRRIDRLVEFADEVWILDYKSDLKVQAHNLEFAAQQHLPQLQSYRQALASVYPRKRLRAGLIFRHGLWWVLPDN